LIGVQVHLQAAWLSYIRGKGRELELFAKHMTYYGVQGIQFQDLQEFSALIRQQPNPLVDAAIGSGEGVGPSFSILIAKFTPLLGRTTVLEGVAQLELRDGLFIQPSPRP
jgi:hypothetical protein